MFVVCLQCASLSMLLFKSLPQTYGAETFTVIGMRTRAPKSHTARFNLWPVWFLTLLLVLFSPPKQEAAGILRSRAR